jgi:hypothetical protein
MAPDAFRILRHGRDLPLAQQVLEFFVAHDNRSACPFCTLLLT